MYNESTQHIPVLLGEVLSFLHPVSGGTYIDGTLGGGGHTEALLEKSAPDGRVLGIDVDQQALERVGLRLAHYREERRLILARGNFAHLADIAARRGVTSAQGILLDLGFSSDQMNNPERGFAFSTNGPLDMRLDQSLPLSAADLVNELSEQELADIFWRYGEEVRSRQIARRIVREREKAAITRTTQLATLVAAGVPFRFGTIHPATRTFQALRIAVNRELEQLEAVLPQIIDLLVADRNMPGRVAIISFHSLEDRIVKDYFRRESTDCLCPPYVPVCQCDHTARLRLITRKPVVPTEQEILNNPRARSAKLRVAEVV
jgi:16S rRNA (cytosine1402-N4)-methyltransferase